MSSRSLLLVVLIFFKVLLKLLLILVFFFQAEDGILDYKVTGVQTCFFFQAEDGIRDYKVTGVRRVLFRSRAVDRRRARGAGFTPGRSTRRQACRGGGRRRREPARRLRRRDRQSDRRRQPGWPACSLEGATRAGVAVFERGLCPRNPGGRHGGARREACDDGRRGRPRGRSPLGFENRRRPVRGGPMIKAGE